MKLTDTAKRLYIASQGIACPYCQSDDIETLGATEVYCHKCGRAWDETTDKTGKIIDITEREE